MSRWSRAPATPTTPARSTASASRTPCQRRSKRACSFPKPCWSTSACRWATSSPRSTRSATSTARCLSRRERRSGRGRAQNRAGRETANARKFSRRSVSLLRSAVVQRRRRLAGEQGGQRRGRAGRGSDIDRRSRVHVGRLALAILEERLVARIRPEDLIALSAARTGRRDRAGADDLALRHGLVEAREGGLSVLLKHKPPSHRSRRSWGRLTFPWIAASAFGLLAMTPLIELRIDTS